MSDHRPTHVARPRSSGGKLTAICGARRDDKLPLVGVDHVQAHIDGRGMIPCGPCLAALDEPSQLALEVAP